MCMKLTVQQQGGTRYWPIRIYEDPLSLIQNEGKTIEGRVPEPSIPRKNYENMSAGDVIVFILRKDGESIQTDYAYRVEYVSHYPTIREMLDKEGVKNLLPHVDSIEEGVELYHSFGGYKKRAEKHGAYAIKLGRNVNPENIPSFGQ